jgi:hypothetical protein
VQRLLRVLVLASTLGATLALGASPAQAGTYTIDQATALDMSGWQYVAESGYTACSRQGRAGVCAQSGVGNPSPLRIFITGTVAADSNAKWRWEAPPGVSIVSGSASVGYKVTANTRVYMKAWLKSELVSQQKPLNMTASDGSATWSIPAGNEGATFYLESLERLTFADEWLNSLRVERLRATLRDDRAPTVSLDGPLADGSWQSSPQPVCLTVSAADAGSGVKTAELIGPQGAVLQSHTAGAGTALQPGDTNYAHDLCLPPASLGDGTHALAVRVTDVAGEQTTSPVTVKVDAGAPSLATHSPAAPTTDRRTPVSFSVDPGPSGLASLSAAMDGTAMTVNGATATLQPVADLAYGIHTVTWRATDVAGNSRDGFWSFQVIDTDLPVLSAAVPAAGSAFEERSPQIGFRLDDAGSGVDPSTLRVLLDGIDVAPLGTFANGMFAVVPAADLAFGTHELRVMVADRSGNAMPTAIWRFAVEDRTAPVLGDVRPDDGAAGSDRTPVISFAVDDQGTGIDPAAFSLTIDGTQVVSLATFLAGRLSYVPEKPLGFGEHVVAARAGDRSGNVSAPLTWRFTVRDEVAPTISRQLPAPGVTVAGATPIGFDVTDIGVGVDPASLVVGVDGSDVAPWGTLAGGRFLYTPGNLGAGVHTVSVTVADLSGNLAGPLMWQFAVADPARLDLVIGTAPGSLLYGGRGVITAVARSNGSPLAGAEVRVSSRPAGSQSFGPSRLLVASSTGEIRWEISPSRTTEYRLELVGNAAEVLTRTVVVRQRVSLRTGASQTRRGMPIRLSGWVAPARSGTVQVQLLTRRGWRTVASPRVGARGGFAATLVPRVAGRYVFRTVAAPTAANAAGVSGNVMVRVR